VSRVLITTVPFAVHNRLPLDLLEGIGVDYVINPIGRRLTEDELADLVGDTEILIAGTEPITAKLWEVSAGGPYLALSSQHTICAVSQLRAEALARHEALPGWMVEVRATIYARSTSLSVRQLISGGDQNVQAAVVPVLLSTVMQVTLDELAKDSGLAVKDAVKLAITKTGFRRPTTTKQLDEFVGPANWAASCSSVAVDAIKAMEAHGLATSIASLRSLRGLMTPKARLAMAQRMLQGLRTQQAFEAAAKEVRHDMLVDLHWRQGNPHLDAEKGAHPFHCCAVARSCGGLVTGGLG
jgi:D-3-phosphoglycerate dehydrogenase